MKEDEALPADILAEVVRQASPNSGTFLVGGQALNFWVEHYSHKSPDLKQYGPFASKDVDFFGTVDAARKLAAALGGNIRLPSADNHTPQSAIVEAVVRGRKIEIDFLWNILGPPADQLKKAMVEITYPLRLDGVETTVPMSVIHPLHCLQSRAANVVTLGRKTAISMRQLNTAPIVLREYISEAIGNGDDPKRVRVGTSVLQKLHHYLSSDIVGTRLHNVCDNNPLNVIRAFADDSRLDPRYRANQLSSMIEEIAVKQTRGQANTAFNAFNRGWER